MLKYVKLVQLPLPAVIFDIVLKKRSFLIITTLMTVALLGVFALQLYYIKEAYNLKLQLFEQDVKQALSATVSKLQKHDAYKQVKTYDAHARQEDAAASVRHTAELIDLKRRYKTDEELKKQRRRKLIEGEIIYQESLISASYFSPLPISEKEYRQIMNAKTSPLHIQINADVDGNMQVRGGRISSTLGAVGRKPIVYTYSTLPDTLRYLVYEPGTLSPRLISLPKINGEMRARFKKEDAEDLKNFNRQLAALRSDSAAAAKSNRNIVSDVVNEMQQKNIPLEKRIDFALLNRLLANELAQHNIRLRYVFRVTHALNDRVVYQQALNDKRATFSAKEGYRTLIFSNDLLRDPGVLQVNFINKQQLLLQNMAFSMVSSALLLLVLICIFTYTLYTILKQKKISEMKTDFINNMTHEFKTPVSTIMLASEALKDADVAANGATVKRLAGVIYDENVRLGNHIERVLSMARLEKNELQMQQEVIDLNDLVVAVADSMALQFERRGAVTQLQLTDSRLLIMGDELHLSNVIFNLLDNAVKYSNDAPHISISTVQNGGQAVLSIQDEGIGMAKDQLKRIFDQFYRVPTGNVHDVKGFGLGLNYVHDIVKRFGGSIKVQSEKEKGTCFTITFPLVNN